MLTYQRAGLFLATRSATVASALLLLTVGAATCSPSSSGPATGADAGRGGGDPSGEGGRAVAGTRGDSEATGGNGGTAGGRAASRDAAAPHDGPVAKSSEMFTCNEVLGIGLTNEWYTAGFEDGVDGSRWQLRWSQGATMDVYADPGAAAWRAPVVSPCASATAAPDRVLFVAWSWAIHDADTWRVTLERAVNTVRSKVPSARAIELLTIVRGPGNTACGGPNAAESTRVPSYADTAAAEIAAASGGLVRIAPPFEAPTCDLFQQDSPHLTATGNATVARLIAAHYR